MATVINVAPPAPIRSLGASSVQIDFDNNVVTDTPHGTASTKSHLNSNRIRTRMFRDTAIRMKADRVYIKRYEDMLASAYVEALRKQVDVRTRRSLGTRVSKKTKSVRRVYESRSRVGYATGKLKKSIEASVQVRLKKNIQKGNAEIRFRLIADYNDYGNYLMEGRKASPIPLPTLIKWIKVKSNLGVFKISLKPAKATKSSTGRRVQSQTKAERIKNVAYLINRAFSLSPREPILKDWANYDKNAKLQREFKKLTKSKGAYHRAQIRKSIMNNISVNYGG